MLWTLYVNQNIAYLKKFPWVFCNESNYNYNFVMKDLGKEFEGDSKYWKICKKCAIKYKDDGYCLENPDVKHDLILYKPLCCNRNYQKKFENFKKAILLKHTIFITSISINLFWCHKIVFAYMNARMTGNISVKL